MEHARGFFNEPDLPHIGALCKRVRENRGIPLREMAIWCGLDPEAQHTRISRNLEQNGGTSPGVFQKYVEGLQSSDLVGPYPIADEQATMLLDLFANRSKRRIEQHQCRFAAVNFENTKRESRSGDMRKLIDELQTCGRPAYIIDDLWFIHAINGEMLALFRTAPDFPYFSRWDAWHSIAIKIAVESHIRAAYPFTWEFLPVVLAWFFQSKPTYTHLFTHQMQCLISRMLRMSVEENYTLHHAWNIVSAFAQPYDFATVVRSLDVDDNEIRMRLKFSERRLVDLGADAPVGFTMTYFEPYGTDAIRHFEKSLESELTGRIFFATDYDRDNNFHVNTWPEVTGEIQRWTKEGVC